MHLLHYLYCRLELLAVEPFCGRHHQHVPIDQDNDEEKRIWCCSVGIFFVTLDVLVGADIGSSRLAANVTDEQDGVYSKMSRGITKRNWAYTVVSYTEWCWILLALASTVLQATRTSEMSSWQETLLYYGELGITLAFDVEIFLRIFASLPDWRDFFMHGKNVLDLVLAVGSSVIQLPVIHSSGVYPWLTVFQLARFYRVILVWPNMKPMMVR